MGKSTVTAQLALAHQMMGLRVGVLDVDLCGPSIPRMLGLQGQEVHQSEAGWCPVFTDNSQTLGVMSIGFLLTNQVRGQGTSLKYRRRTLYIAFQDDAVVWRGPKKNAIIKQFLTDVVWNDRDVLIVDTPPGTSDEHITVMEALKETGVTAQVDGAVLVTTPQAVAVGDVRREISFCRKVGLKMLGVIENMSGYVCPHCSECTNIFSAGGGKSLAEHANIPFLGTVPIEPKLALAAESGVNFIEQFKECEANKCFVRIFEALNKNK